MRGVCAWIAVIGVLATAPRGDAQDDAATKELEKQLAKIDADLKKKPDDPQLHYRKAQCQMKLARYDDGYATAKKAMELFIKKGDDLAWMLLESVDLGHARVDVHFNMGERERKPPDIGIVRPLSFRIWKKAEKAPGELVEIIDFEFAMMDGEPATAAFGVTKDRKHTNLGMQAIDTPYKTIREKAVELIKKRHPEPEKK